MDREKRMEYASALLNAYENSTFEIVWGASGFSMAVDSRKRDLIPELKEKDFVDYAFSIIKMVIDLAEERQPEEECEEDLEVAKTIFNKERDLKNHLYIKRNSKIDCFKLLEYEIISHRKDDDPTNIEATSAILKMVIEKDDEETSYVFEVSRRDLEGILDKLVELKEKIDIIRG